MGVLPLIVLVFVNVADALGKHTFPGNVKSATGLGLIVMVCDATGLLAQPLSVVTESVMV